MATDHEGMGRAMAAGMEASLETMAPFLAPQMIQATAEAIKAFLHAAESAKRLGDREMHNELIIRAKKLLTLKGGT